MTKSLGFWRTWALVVGTMIGSGVFLLPAVLAPYGSYSLAGWIVAGTGTLLIAITLGSLARRIPKIGGPYAYTRAAFGDLPAFLVGWGYWIGVWAAVAALGVAFSGYMAVFIPSLATVPVAGGAGALVIVWLVVGINLSGMRSAGVVQLVTTILKLLPLLLIAFAGLFVGDVATIPANNPEGKSLPMLFAGLATLTMWAYIGVEAATVPADDIIRPERTIPRALVSGALTVTAVYILATLGVMALIPSQELSQSTAPFADAASGLFGSFGAKLVGLGALVSILGSLNSNVLLTGQMPRAAALDGLFPGRFGSLNANQSPAFALTISAGLSSLLVIMNYSRGLLAAFTTLILLSTLSTLIPYAVSAVADLVIQRREAQQGDRIRWRSIVIAVLAFLFSIFAIIGSGLRIASLGLLLLAAGLPVYYGVTRRARSG